MKERVEPLNWSLAGAPKLPAHKDQAFVTNGDGVPLAGKIYSVNLGDGQVLVRDAQALAKDPKTKTLIKIPVRVFRERCIRISARALRHIIGLFAKDEEQALAHIVEVVAEQTVSTSTAAEPVEKPKAAPVEKAKEAPAAPVPITVVGDEQLKERSAVEIVTVLASKGRTPEESKVYNAALRVLAAAWGGTEELNVEQQSLVKELREILAQPRLVVTLTQCGTCQAIARSQETGKKLAEARMGKRFT